MTISDAPPRTPSDASSGDEEGGWRTLAPSAILVVDDEQGVRETVRRSLEGAGYSVVTASCLDEAREQLEAQHIMVVLADVTLHGELGLDLLAELRAERPEVAVLIMTANSDLESAVTALQHGAYDYLCKPFPFEVLHAAVERALERVRLAEKSELLTQLEERHAAEQDHLQGLLVSIASFIDAKSRFTARHSRRVAELAELLAEALGLSSEDRRRCALGGRLHDIGKIGIPDAILDKAGPLTDAEFAVMKTHPVVGDQMLAPLRALSDLRPMVRWHHETLDGRGYPDGLGGDDVPLEAWIVKVADYWEAITSLRPYREPMSLDEAARCLRGEAGTRIPRHVVDAFLDVLPGAPVALPPVPPRMEAEVRLRRPARPTVFFPTGGERGATAGA